MQLVASLNRACDDSGWIAVARFLSDGLMKVRIERSPFGFDALALMLSEGGRELRGDHLHAFQQA